MNGMSEQMISSSLKRNCISKRRKSLLASNAMRDKIAKKNRTKAQQDDNLYDSYIFTANSMNSCSTNFNCNCIHTS